MIDAEHFSQIAFAVFALTVLASAAGLAVAVYFLKSLLGS